MSKDNPTLQDLVKYPKHKHYYFNPITKAITYRRSHKGVAVKIPTGLTSIQKAKEYVEIELKSRASGESVKKIKSSRRGVKNPTGEFLWQECIGERAGRERSTHLTYRTNWKYSIGPFWAKRTLKDFNDKNVILYRDWYLSTRPDKQYDDKTFSMWLNFLVRRRYLAHKPDLTPVKELSKLIRKNTKIEKAGRIATEEEQIALLNIHEKLVNTPLGGDSKQHKEMLATRAKVWIMLGLRFGLRKMEAGKLRWEKIDFKKRLMLVWSTKNHKWREIPLPDEALAVLKEQKSFSKDSEWVFPMPTNSKRHISSQVFDKQWVLAKRLAGIQGRLRFHDLRHTFATRTAEEDWPPVLACAILDMSLKIYQTVYCKPSLKSKEQLLIKSFGSLNPRGSE